MASAAEERPKEDDAEASGEGDRMVMYKLKHIEFLGRSTPIILQNENGPCPLLAICNVLLLRNVMNLHPDAGEVSQDQLLAMVADRLLESNIDAKFKGEEYVQNQQQNISDAIDLLPQLATGIDVNVLFRKINDFEFTRECAIFDLLDIGLYHGWIVDPEDKDTAEAIGLKSYNTLVGEIVALPAHMSEKEQTADDSVDFVAATTAALGVPSPCISRGRSFDEPPVSIMHEKARRKGDLEEEEEVLRALQLSVSESSSSAEGKSLLSESTHGLTSVPEPSDVGTSSEKSEMINPLEQFDGKTTENFDNTLSKCNTGVAHPEVIEEKDTDNLGTGVSDLSVLKEVDDSYDSNKVVATDLSTKKQNASLVPSITNDLASCIIDKERSNPSLEDDSVQQMKEPIIINTLKPNHDSSFGDLTIFSNQAASNMNIDASDSGKCSLNAPESVCSSLEGSEPIYEGEECVIDTGHQGYQSPEPIYEGEIALAEQAVKRGKSATSMDPADETAGESNDGCSISSRDVWLIRTFLENNKSQLTIYGLFRLQEGLKERELCVFFRNNHFSTMFKFKDELYLLATDQGYINQSDLVWEKLNEVNGNTVFMTSSFEEFKVGIQSSDSWNQDNTATDYLESIKGSAAESSNINSDLQLALALQEQEFEQQTPNPPPNPPPKSKPNQPYAGSRPELIVGPRVPSRPPPPKESKAKDKCVVM